MPTTRRRRAARDILVSGGFHVKRRQGRNADVRDHVVLTCGRHYHTTCASLCQDPRNTTSKDRGSTPGRIRTYDRRFRKPLLYPLSYGRDDGCSRGEIQTGTPVLRHGELDASRDETDRRPSWNAPGRIRTCDLRFRKPPLYPPELRALWTRFRPPSQPSGSRRVSILAWRRLSCQSSESRPNPIPQERSDEWRAVRGGCDRRRERHRPGDCPAIADLGFNVVVNYRNDRGRRGNVPRGGMSRCAMRVRDPGGRRRSRPGPELARCRFERRRAYRSLGEQRRGRPHVAVGLAGDEYGKLGPCPRNEPARAVFLDAIRGPRLGGTRRRKVVDEPRIVFITSISSTFASVNRGEYCVSKAGLSMVARLFAVRLADLGVRRV